MSEMIFYVVILFVSVIISAFSQILLKKSALKKHKSLIYEYLNPFVIVSYLIFFCAIFLDMIGLKKVPVSFIPVIESSSYIFIIVFSRIFLKEKFSKRKIISMLIIFAGISIFVT